MCVCMMNWMNEYAQPISSALQLQLLLLLLPRPRQSARANYAVLYCLYNPLAIILRLVHFCCFVSTLLCLSVCLCVCVRSV